MYARLSPETVNFINRGVSRNNDLSYREALNRYAEEITCAIREVCNELSNETILDHEWSIAQEDEDDIEEQIQLTIYQKHSRNFFVFSIDEAYNCTWSYYHLDGHNMESEMLRENNPSFNRYFQVNQLDDRLIISSTFSKRQLVSRYLVDYIIHLTKQLAPAIEPLSRQVHAVAA